MDTLPPKKRPISRVVQGWLERQEKYRMKRRKVLDELTDTYYQAFVESVGDQVEENGIITGSYNVIHPDEAGKFSAEEINILRDNILAKLRADGVNCSTGDGIITISRLQKTR